MREVTFDSMAIAKSLHRVPLPVKEATFYFTKNSRDIENFVALAVTAQMAVGNDPECGLDAYGYSEQTATAMFMCDCSNRNIKFERAEIEKNLEGLEVNSRPWTLKIYIDNVPVSFSLSK